MPIKKIKKKEFFTRVIERPEEPVVQEKKTLNFCFVNGKKKNYSYNTISNDELSALLSRNPNQSYSKIISEFKNEKQNKQDDNFEEYVNSFSNEEYVDDYSYNDYAESLNETSIVKDEVVENVFQEEKKPVTNKFSFIDDVNNDLEDQVEEENNTTEETFNPTEKVVNEPYNPFKNVEASNSSFNSSTPKTRVHKHQHYVLPSLTYLKKSDGTSSDDIEIAEEQKKIINEFLLQNGVGAHVAKYIFGPTVIIHLIEFDSYKEDIKVLNRFEDNLAMYLRKPNITIETPVPGMRYAGITVPREQDNRQIVYLGDVLSSQDFQNSEYELPIAIGKDNFNRNVIIDIRDMPHALCAGATKSGKSVCLNSIILSLIYKYTPDDVRLVLIDPKVVEFAKYADLPNLALPVITDADKFESVIEWMFEEMERRYQILNKYNCIDLKELNEELIAQGQEKLPYIVMIMDEFTDWILAANNNIITLLTRLCGKARAAGMHIILSALRPSADVIHGSIKTNIATRFAFHVSSSQDSVVVLGQGGAEKLLGKGDMILRHTGQDDMRLQATFVSKNEILSVIDFLRNNNDVDYLCTEEELKQNSQSRAEGHSQVSKSAQSDELFKEVALFVVRNDNASVNSVSNIYSTGFNRMNAIFIELEKLGIISGTQQGTKRKVLVTEEQLDDILDNL